MTKLQIGQRYQVFMKIDGQEYKTGPRFRVEEHAEEYVDLMRRRNTSENATGITYKIDVVQL